MNAKTVFASAMILTVLGVCEARAGDWSGPPVVFQMEEAPPPRSAEPRPLPAGPEGSIESAPLPSTKPGEASGNQHVTPGLSSWITYTRPDCCGPIGGDGPIFMELYLRAGVSLPVVGEVLSHVLETGWEVQAGGRSLLFDPEGESAWTIDLSLSQMENHGQRSDIVFPVLDSLVSMKALHRTFVNAAVGREWYLYGPATACGTKWRAGIDLGGRYGTGRADFNDSPFTHRTDTLYGTFVAVHSDVECTCGCCIFSYGFRAEWDYMWSDLLAESNGDMMDVNLLLTAGVRF
jgi:hypothetical protein